MIRTIPSAQELPEGAELWRYMRLSTFLMLLRGKVYVPTIADLRRRDPLEATRLCQRTREYFDHLTGPDRDWLLAGATEREQAILNHPKAQPEEKARVFRHIWDRELAERRTIWCWHQAKIESMALWHIYAREGVAVKTTPARLKSAFDPHFVGRGLIGPVHYIDDSHQEALDHHFLRPYLLKQRCYQHEREVRVVLPRNPDDPDGRRLLPIDPRKLISEVLVSPLIPHSEAAEIRRSLVWAWKTGAEWNEENEHDVPVFVSDTRTVFKCAGDRLLQNESETTGITNFGSRNMPFVTKGDFDDDEVRARELSRLVLAGGRRTEATENKPQHR
jgi:hypothetical protein